MPPATVPARLTRLLRSYDAEEPVAASFRAKQVQAVLRLTPLTMLANVFNVAVVCLIFRASPHAMLIWLWGLLVLASSAVGLRPWLRMRRGDVPGRASRRAMGRALRHASALALLWAVLPALAFPGAAPDEQLVVAAIATGMICAGGFALATVPAAALAFVAILTTGTAAGFALDGLARHAGLLVLLGVYAFIVAASVIASSRTFGARLMAEAEAARQKTVVGLLLHDFEAHASDWLWEIDNEGFLRHVSAKLAESFGLPVDALRTRRFVDLFDPAGDEEHGAAVAALRRRLAAATPFRDAVVPVRTRDTILWWSLTAKPLLDEAGHPVGWRGVGSDVTLRHNADIEMRRLANFDSLTGLANRHSFHAQLALLRASGPSAPARCALLYFDLDNFKNVNDSLGHATGDRVLQIVAQRLQGRVRSGDLIARIGGDEFALICWQEAGMEASGHLARRLLDAFRAPCHVDGATITIGSSIGIALAPEHGSDPDRLLRCADMALYEAKAAGRNTFRFFEPAMELRMQQHLTLLNDLRDAVETGMTGPGLRHGPFELHYQPQVSFADGRIKGFEALMRWRHPARGPVSPVEFIPAAEESGLIVPMGTWALRRACEEAMTWPGALRIAVNVSAVQFGREEFVDIVADALDRSRLPARRLELEITESLLLQDSAAATVTLAALRELGVRVAIDDFGTGYSSLAYLRRFPIDKLKIDRSFVAALGGDPGARAIAETIVRLAAALGLETTAEGVETEAQVEVLRAIGCSDAQGYLFARPMPARDVAARLADDAAA